MTRSALVVVGVVLVTGCTPADRPVPAGTSAVAPPTGAVGSLEQIPVKEFLVALDHAETESSTPAGTPQVAWRTAWTLSWPPVPDAQGYAVYYATNEGTGSEAPRQVTDVPLLRIEAAAGTSSPDRLEQDRAAGLIFTSSQLLVSVAPRSADGAVGARSPWFPVGDAPADGRPIAVAAPQVPHTGS